MTNEEFQRSKSFEENLKEWNLLSLEEMGESVKEGSLYVIGNGFDITYTSTAFAVSFAFSSSPPRRIFESSIYQSQKTSHIKSYSF